MWTNTVGQTLSNVFPERQNELTSVLLKTTVVSPMLPTPSTFVWHDSVIVFFYEKFILAMKVGKIINFSVGKLGSLQIGVEKLAYSEKFKYKSELLLLANNSYLVFPAMKGGLFNQLVLY